MGEVIASQTLISCTSDVLPSRAREGSTVTSSWGVSIKTKNPGYLLGNSRAPVRIAIGSNCSYFVSLRAFRSHSISSARFRSGTSRENKILICSCRWTQIGRNKERIKIKKRGGDNEPTSWSTPTMEDTFSACRYNQCLQNTPGSKLRSQDPNGLSHMTTKPQRSLNNRKTSDPSKLRAKRWCGTVQKGTSHAKRKQKQKV